jgi:signal transduction histidine kinase
MKRSERTPEDPVRAALDSQEALALSIVRSIRQGMPPSVSEADLETSVESALTAEARRNERTIAGLRVGFLLVLAVLNASALMVPQGPAFHPANVLYMVLAASAALVFYGRLRQGWYHPWLRRLVPLADALLIAGAFFVYAWTRPESIAVGVVAVSVTACVFLAFSGALRLSRSAARLATALAIAAWLSVALISWSVTEAPGITVAAFELAFVTAALFGAGYLGAHVTRTIRRVVTNEVGRARYATLYNDAQLAIEAREEVLHIVSHDLRNPLNTIAITAEYLMSPEADLTVDRRNEFLGRICRAGERMNRMVQDLLDVARMEAGKLSVDPAPVACAELFGEVSDTMAPLAAERQLELRVLCPDDPPTVLVDRDRIMQVFSNLIGNAIKFTPSGGTICVQWQRMGEKVRFSVSDTGPGIPAEQRENIFQRLWQADRSDGRGLGLGLAIARSIVEAHNERIGLESQTPGGTTFWFTAATFQPPTDV